MKNWEFRQFPPTLARGKFKDEYMNDGNAWLAEEKYDGDRRIGQFTEEGVRFTGRRTSVVNGVKGLLVEKTDQVPHLKLGGEQWDHLLGTVLDGEFTLPGKRSNAVTSIMGSKPEKAIKKQEENGWIEWKVFDCLFFKGTDIRMRPLHERRKFLMQALLEWNNECAHISGASDFGKDRLLNGIWKRGGEGIILKHRDSTYNEHLKWVKVKRELTEDVVVMGYDDPEEFSTKIDGTLSRTKFFLKNWIGAIRFGQYKDGELKYCGSASGMTDEMREEISLNKAKYLMKVMEVEANEREPSGKFRHPRFVQFRNNKDPEDCIWSAGK